MGTLKLGNKMLSIPMREEDRAPLDGLTSKGWTAGGTEDGSCICFVTDADGKRVATVTKGREKDWHEAAVMAAAPELLEALNGLLDSWKEHRGLTREALTQARNAIVKATL